MHLLKCPKCGEMFSDTYKTCPFCQEDEEIHSGKPVKTGGRRVGGGKARPKVGGGVVVACLVLVLGLVVFTVFGNQLTAFLTGNKDVPEPAPEVLTLSQASADLTVGGSVKLTASGSDSSISFTSSDEAVATVSADGTVQAVGEGSAVVTAKAGDQTASCSVDVKAAGQKPEPVKPDVPATSLTLRSIFQAEGTSLDEFSIAPGGEVRMVVDGTDSVVTWKIDDTSVATISADGVVTGVSSDASKVTTITATVDGQTLTCNVRGGGSN